MTSPAKSIANNTAKILAKIHLENMCRCWPKPLYLAPNLLVKKQLL